MQDSYPLIRRFAPPSSCEGGSPTRLIRSINNIPPNLRGGVVAIGNFDGVHLGHQALIAKVVARARERGVSAMVVTFEPHPGEFFGGEKRAVARLTRLREKFVALAGCGVDGMVILPFNQLLAGVSASDFVTNVLVNALGACHVVIGDDFRFGHQRQGDLALLGTRSEFTVEAMSTQMLDDERVSSTRVRQALAAGDHVLAEKLLGRPYSMSGRIQRGDQLGREWGFPTANIDPHRRLSPVQGIYTVYVHGLGEHPLPGVASIGTRPTIDGTKTLLEVHLLDFNQDIYGRYVQVTFCEKLRDEAHFPTIVLLREQIAKDVAIAHDYFHQQGVL